MTSRTFTDVGRLCFLKLQLDDLASIKGSADAFMAKEPKLDVLWNNASAGSIFDGVRSAQGHDIQMATNRLGSFLFTKLLLPRLLEGSQSRVVWTTSMLVDAAAPKGGMDHADFDKIPSDPNDVHTDTKVCKWSLASEFARRYQSRSVSSASQSPGNLMTRIWRHQHWLMVKTLSPVLHHARMGAYTKLWAGLAEEIDVENNGSLIMPWRKFHHRPLFDILEALKSRDDGRSGRAADFWVRCERPIVFEQ